MDLELYAGDGASFTVVATNAAGAPLNLTGTFNAALVNNRDDAGPVLTFTIDTTQAAVGKLILSLTGVQTARLKNQTRDPWRGFWDLQWAPTVGQPLTLVQGDVTCDLDVSH